MNKISKEVLRNRLSGVLPGTSAHSRMAPPSRLNRLPDETCRDAAVMFLIFPEDGMLKTVFIKRNEYDGPHSGQIALPGGMKEEGDKDLEFTARRETSEEIGVHSSEIEILGKLTELYIPVSNFCVHPFLGWIDHTPVFHPDPAEVQYLICPALQELSDTANRKSGIISIDKRKIDCPYFEVEGEIIWGATAMILGEIIEITGY